MSCLRSCYHRVKDYLSIEPIVFLTTMGVTIALSFYPSRMQDKFAWLYRDELSQLHNETSRATRLQQIQTKWNILQNFVAKPLLIIATLFYGALSDRIGRKSIILLSVVSAALRGQLYSAFLSKTFNLGAWWIFVLAFVFSVLGGDSVSDLNCAYLVDKDPDPTALSLRMSLVMVISLVTMALGNNLGMMLAYTADVNIHWIITIGAFFLFIAAVYTLLYLKDLQPRRREHSDTTTNVQQQQQGIAERGAELANETSVAQGDDEEETRRTSKSLVDGIREAALLEIEAIKVVFRQRKGHRRFLLICSLMAGALVGITEKQEETLLGTYTLQPPFNWREKEFLLYMNINTVSLLAGTLFGMFLMKKVFHMRDTSIMLFGFAVNAADVLVTANARSSLAIYIGTLICEGLVVAVLPASMAFTSTLVPPDEIGKVYAVYSVLEQVNSVLQLLVLQPIYLLTVAWYKQTIWYILAVINIAAFAMMLVVHFVSKRDEQANLEHIEINKKKCEETSPNSLEMSPISNSAFPGANLEDRELTDPLVK